MKCQICNIRKPRRYCPGVSGEICSLCCGTEREVTVNCPHDCEYLREARIHERPPDIDPGQIPNRDIRITEEFIGSHEPLITFLCAALIRSVLDAPSVIDSDVREALESLVRTYRTLQSGLYYESLPENPLAAAICKDIAERIAELKESIREQTGASIRDAEILGVLVFLQRIESQHNNGRKMGRAFIDFLRSYFPKKAPSEAQPLLIEP